MTWRFSDFYEMYNRWIDVDDPPEEFRFWVMAWLSRMQENPQVDAALAPVGDPWWFVKIPHAEDGTHGVVCLYSIKGDHVQCATITTLRKPII